MLSDIGLIYATASDLNAVASTISVIFITFRCAVPHHVRAGMHPVTSCPFAPEWMRPFNETPSGVQFDTLLYGFKSFAGDCGTLL